MRVLISGAGFAGPCLAHGLRRHGHEVLLFERDPAIDTRAQGYRIHISGDGDAALREWLPAGLYELAADTSCVPGGSLGVLSTDLRTYTEIEIPPGTGGLTVDRLTLRRIMMRGLEDVTRFGAGCSRYEVLEDGTVRAFLTDGSTAEGDLLVAADGTGSAIRRQLLPGFPVTVQDKQLVYGRTPLSDRVRQLTPPPALDGFVFVADPDGRGLALAAQRFRRAPQEFGLPAAGDYVMWCTSASSTVYGPGLFGLAAEELVALAAKTVSDWSPALGTLIRLAERAHVVPASVYSSERPEPGPPVPVTLAGDAAHPMPPAGISAGVALHDAGLLAARLVSDVPLLDAVRSYEEEMFDHGFAAVEAASRTFA